MNPRLETALAARLPVVGRRAFSLLEMIGVLAILAVLAALLLPAWIKRIDLATRAQEAARLETIRQALLLHGLRSETIPTDTSWEQAAATWSRLPVGQIANNARRYRRLYFFQTGPNPAALPYTQTAAGTTRPANLRAAVVSILGGAPLSAANCPAPAGGSLTEADFDALWNTPADARPTGGAWAWNGRGDDFLVERIDYAPLFHHLVLVNRDTLPASFNINGSSAVAVVRTPNNNVGWDAYYLDGTVVGLGDTNGTLMTRHVLTRDISFVFEEGMWRGQIMGLSTGNNLADDFGDKAAAFLAAQWHDTAKGGDQQAALVCMYSFMYTYTLWANQCPHFPSHYISSAEQVPEYKMLQAVADDNKVLDTTTDDGVSGLLKKK